MSCTKIQILRVEGNSWDNSNIGCYVSINEELIDVITPLNSQHESNLIKIPPKGELKLFIKTMGDQSKFLGNTTVLIEALPSKGYAWLPLATTLSKTVLNSIPDIVENPKILLALFNSSKQIELKDESILYDKLCVEDLKLQLKELQSQLAEEKKSRTTYQEAYKIAVSTNSKQLSSFEMRESSLIKLLEQKDKEIQKLKQESEKNEISLKKHSEEKAKLLEKIEDHKLHNCVGIIERLSNEIDETKKLFTASVKQRIYLCNQMKLNNIEDIDCSNAYDSDRSLLDLKAEIIQLDEENKTLKKKLAQCEKTKESLNSQVFELQNVIETGQSDCDKKMMQNVEGILVQLGASNLFKKKWNCYTVGNNVVQLGVEEGKLVVGFEGEFYGIEEFLKINAGDFRIAETERCSSVRSGCKKNLTVNNFQNVDKRNNKIVGVLGESRSIRKIPERVLKDRNLRENPSCERKKF